MTTPGKQRGKRDFFDVWYNDKSTSSTRHFFKSLFYGKHVLDLKPKFRFRHPWIWTFSFFGIVILLFVGMHELSTRAETQDFYPTTCLGNWQNVANAQGDPAAITSPTSTFSSADSAMYAGSGTEIYCGGFIPPTFATSGDITNVGLTLVWQIGDAPAATTTVIASSSDTGSFTPAADDSSTVATTTATGDDDASSPVVPTTTPAVTPDVASSSDGTSAPVITPPPASTDGDGSSAPAPDTSTPTPTATPAPAADPSATPPPTTSFVRQLIPVAFADDIASTTDSSTTVVTPPVIPDQNFLDVSYSTDGQTWISIGKVSVTNWQEFTVTLPISDWNDLENLQIRVQGLPTTQDPIPPVYLEGMLVEVHYSIPSPILATTPATNGSSSVAVEQVVQVSPNITVTNPPPSPLPTVPAPTITDIAKTGDQVSVTVQYVGDFYGGNPIYLFVYPDGTTANRNDADSAFMFAGQPTEGPAINGQEIAESAFDPTTKQATVTIVAPTTLDDSEITTAAMTTGTYDVDVSYFDSETWHLIPAQTFTWP